MASDLVLRYRSAPMTDTRPVLLAPLVASLLAIGGCSSAPAAPDAASSDAGAHAPDAYAPDAYAPDAYAHDAYAHDAYAPDAFVPDDTGTDAGNSCVAAGHVCITMMPLSCSLPDMPDPFNTCGPGQQCCIPATGGPVTCESAGGRCFVPMPLACAPGNRIGEPEIYTCPSGQQCCLPLPPGP